MQTKYELIGVDSISRTNEIDWPREPSFTQIKSIVEPLIQSEGSSQAYMEHVRVWFNGAYCSMFVDDSGQLKNLPVNEAATLIYEANLREHDPALLASLPPTKIHGPAVLFHRNVWY